MYSKTRGPKGQKHAVSLLGRAPMASGAAVAVTLQPANQGDSETVKESLRGQKAPSLSGHMVSWRKRIWRARTRPGIGNTRARDAFPMETRAVQRQRAKAVILSTACIALALSITDNARARLPWSAFHAPALHSVTSP